MPARPNGQEKLLRYITDFDLPEQLRKKYTVSVPNSKYNAKWQKLMLSRTSPAADGTAAICNYCRRRLKRRIMPDHAIADGMWMGEASSIPEYADLSEMEVMLLAERARQSRPFILNLLQPQTEYKTTKLVRF